MKLFYPVVHVLDTRQALEQVGIAHDARADGVWLIHHTGSRDDLNEVFVEVRREHPDFWIGLNYLDLDALGAMRVVGDAGGRVDGLWVDNAGVTERHDALLYAERVWETKRAQAWTGKYFGGVAFKGQKTVQDVEKAARNAAPLMDVVTTSGAGTGIAAPLEKLQRMRTALGDRALAIASGITPENVRDYLPYVDCFLVSTGISNDFHHLDPVSTHAVAETIHEWNAR
jgi:predicted TIM-barrel enzyme